MMEDISDENYTYNAEVPWPERAEKRITNLERESQEHTEEIANTDWNLKALLMRVEALERKVVQLEQQAIKTDATIDRVVGLGAKLEAHTNELERITHRLMNAGESVEDDGR